eukprot:4723015-Prymnesium_polylepis.1
MSASNSGHVRVCYSVNGLQVEKSRGARNRGPCDLALMPGRTRKASPKSGTHIYILLTGFYEDAAHANMTGCKGAKEKKRLPRRGVLTSYEDAAHEHGTRCAPRLNPRHTSYCRTTVGRVGALRGRHRATTY